ncbi:MAG: hypothetical protein J6331_02900, partial [Lentisphaeria bacterium]|nr:hypothetical protein [Lentisphaeria bacterium]
MTFRTPFHLCGGKVLDKDYCPVRLHPKRFRLSSDRKEMENFLAEAQKENIDLIHVEFTEGLLTLPDGSLKEGPALELLDDFMEKSFQKGFYLVFTPVTERLRTPDGWSENAIREDEPIFAERYLDALFRHVNKHSGKRFCEYENLAGIEFVLALETFTPKRLYAYIHHLGCFVQHFFFDQIPELVFLDRGEIPEELQKVIEGFTQLQKVHWFPDPAKFRIPPKLPGLPESAIKAYARESGSPSFLPCPVAAAASKCLGNADPRANGGAEGFVTLESAVSTEFLIEFPCEVKSAKFRPSMRENVPVEIAGKSVRFTLPNSRYGVL